MTATPTASSASPTASGPSAPAGSAASSTPSASPTTAGSAPSPGTPPATSSCTSPPRAPGGCCTPSTSGCSRSSSTYIVNHAEDEVIFVDRSLMGVLWPLVDQFTTVKHVVVMDDGKGDVPDDPRIVDYEELLADAKPVEFHVDDENRAGSMMYTSGTTGNPKGVVYSHRSMFLHTLGAMSADSLGVREADVILPVVPMFHANAWGLAHAAVGAGATLVMPGADLSGPAIAELMESGEGHGGRRRADDLDGRAAAARGRDVSSLRAIPCGGSAVPKALSEGFRTPTGLPLLQAWGMTETSPIASVCHIKSTLRHKSRGGAGRRAHFGRHRRARRRGARRRARHHQRAALGRRERAASSRWPARGSPATYYNDDRSAESFTEDGWLRTGDVATIDADGYIRLVDRTKDLIKSGGEWISSVELENEIMAHPKVAEAAVIGVPHPKWSERPLACVVVKPGETLTKEELLDLPRAPHGEVVAARRRRVHRRGAEDVGRQVLQEDAARPLRRLPATAVTQVQPGPGWPARALPGRGQHERPAPLVAGQREEGESSGQSDPATTSRARSIGGAAAPPGRSAAGPQATAAMASTTAMQRAQLEGGRAFWIQPWVDHDSCRSSGSQAAPVSGRAMASRSARRRPSVDGEEASVDAAASSSTNDDPMASVAATRVRRISGSVLPRRAKAAAATAATGMSRHRTARSRCGQTSRVRAGVMRTPVRRPG